MKEVLSGKILLYNPQTGEHDAVDALRGESAYEAAVRLGLTTLTEEAWLQEYNTKRNQAIADIQAEEADTLAAIETKRQNAIADADAAIADINQKGEETLASIPEEYTALNQEVEDIASFIESMGFSVQDGILCVTYEE